MRCATAWSTTTAARAGAAPSGKVELRGNETLETLEALLDEYGSVGNVMPAIVISVAEKQAQVFIKGAGMAADRLGRNVVGEAAHFRNRAGT